jgi:hypothetical protein
MSAKYNNILSKGFILWGIRAVRFYKVVGLTSIKQYLQISLKYPTKYCPVNKVMGVHQYILRILPGARRDKLMAALCLNLGKIF